MFSRSATVAAVLAALAIPAIAPAEVGPHSTWYAVHKQEMGTTNDVNIVVQRDKGIADVNGLNHCLGSTKQAGHSYLNSFDAYPVPVKSGRIDYHGKAMVSSGSKSSHQRINITATITPSKAAGQLTLPGTHCGTIKFTAPLALYKA